MLGFMPYVCQYQPVIGIGWCFGTEVYTSNQIT